MHAVDLLGDMLGGSHANELHSAMRMIAEEGRGAVVLIREAIPTSLSERVKKMGSSQRPVNSLRDYGIGAQILVDLGVKDMVLISNTRRSVIGLEAYGLNIVSQRSTEGAAAE
jgi:3,4-dihydroxy 2-butanone 4-phosphate synthase/GTP cyclohydrolase II